MCKGQIWAFGLNSQPGRPADEWKVDVALEDIINMQARLGQQSLVLVTKDHT